MKYIVSSEGIKNGENILTNRLELSFLEVLALPKASNMGFVSSTSYSIPLPPPSAAKYFIAIFAVSVFPAPLSPLQNILVKLKSKH